MPDPSTFPVESTHAGKQLTELQPLPIIETPPSLPPAAAKTAEKATQTDPDPDSTTVNIHLPHRQFSIFHIQQEEEKRISGILLASTNTTTNVDGGGVSISLPPSDNRTSTGSNRSSEKIRSRNSIIIMDGQRESVISIDLGHPTPSDRDVTNTNTKGGSELTTSGEVEDPAAPAYEEVVSPIDNLVESPLVATPVSPPARKQSIVYIRRQDSDLDSVLTSVGDVSEGGRSGGSGDVRKLIGGSSSAATLNDEEASEVGVGVGGGGSGFRIPVIDQSVSGVMLPPLGVSERITNPETAQAVQSLTSTWPILKGGFLLRKEVHLTPSSTSISFPHTSAAEEQNTTKSRPDRPSKILSRGIGSLLKSRSSNSNTANRSKRSTDNAVDEQTGGEEWVLYWVEVRGR
ncbi:hypothetical protein HK097_005634, partial [Rhizophlyctis rosea]